MILQFDAISGMYRSVAFHKARMYMLRGAWAPPNLAGFVTLLA